MADVRYVAVEGIRLRFAAAHMATLGTQLEPLHGHNYSVRCRVDGPLTEDGWVIDFAVLKGAVRDACDRLDHHFLLQAMSPLLAISDDGERLTVAFGARTYVFPKSDVALLPIANTTAELIAEWLSNEVARTLDVPAYRNLRRIEMTVEEMPGQAAGFVLELPVR